MKTKILFIPMLILFISACTSKDKIKIADLAESWIISSYEGKDAAYKMVSENMSDEGYNVGARYIGFGFNFNSDAMESDGMIVQTFLKMVLHSLYLKLVISLFQLMGFSL